MTRPGLQLWGHRRSLGRPGGSLTRRPGRGLKFSAQCPAPAAAPAIRPTPSGSRNPRGSHSTHASIFESESFTIPRTVTLSVSFRPRVVTVTDRSKEGSGAH